MNKIYNYSIINSEICVGITLMINKMELSKMERSKLEHELEGKLERGHHHHVSRLSSVL